MSESAFQQLTRAAHAAGEEGLTYEQWTRRDRVLIIAAAKQLAGGGYQKGYAAGAETVAKRRRR